MTKTLGVIGISFCGSTVFGMAANTHPDVFHVGEISNITGRWYKRMLQQRKVENLPNYNDSFCSFCAGESRPCKIFPMEDYPLLLKNTYSYVREKVGKDITICDTSKTMGWFMELEKCKASDEFFYVLLLKDPIKATYSYVGREYYPWQGKPTLANCLGHWTKHNKNQLSILEKKDRKFAVVIYEDFAKRPDRILTSIGVKMGLSEKFRCSEKDRVEAHFILGNALAKRLKAPIEPKYFSHTEVRLNYDSLTFEAWASAYDLFYRLVTHKNRIY